MVQGSEAFKQEHPTNDETPKPEDKKGAVILAFRQKTGEGDAEEKIQDYKGYKELGGILEPEEYNDVLGRVGKASYNPMWSKHANFMADTAGIASPSKRAVNIYGILRDKKPDPEKESYGEMSDQKLFAEALRIAGDKSSLDKFLDIENYPNILNPKS